MRRQMELSSGWTLWRPVAVATGIMPMPWSVRLPQTQGSHASCCHHSAAAVGPEVPRLQHAIPAILDLTRRAIVSSIAATGTVAIGTLPVEVDVAEFELAIVNLAINAKDAMPSSGKLLISVSDAEP